ncbi:C-type lectin domain family 17, member A, partial [Biomphalaria glabrata]
WIGGLDIKQNGQFVWATTPEVRIVTNIWNNGEPNNYGGNEDCVEMYTSGVLNDINC